MLILAALLLTVSQSISFNYILQNDTVQCFYEQIESGSKFQVRATGNVSEFSLHLSFEETSLVQIEDRDVYIKDYAGYANTTAYLYVCLQYTGEEEAIKVKIDLQSGAELEKLIYEDNKNQKGRARQSLQKLRQVSKNLQSTFQRRSGALSQMTMTYERLSFYMRVTILCLTTLSFIFIVYQAYSLRKDLKQKKII